MRSRKTPHCSGGAQKGGKGTKGAECVGFSVSLPVGVAVICTDFDELGVPSRWDQRVWVLLAVLDGFRNRPRVVLFKKGLSSRDFPSRL